MKAWIFLFLAVVLEIGWATSLKYSQGYTKLWPSILSLTLTLLISFVIAQAFRGIPSATCYAIWTGLGAIGVAISAAFLFGESFTVPKILCMALIFIGVIGLEMVSHSQGH
ncbi:MAG: multidrug efflux SMR transporter [Chthoniobacterales bacterium]